MKRAVLTAGVVLAALSSAPAAAIDGFAVEGGYGENVDRAGVAVQWDWNRQLLKFGDWHVGGYWDVSLDYWNRGSVRAGENDDLFDFGLTPVFRIQPNSLTGPYFEAGIGFHGLTHTQIGNKHLSTAFQFGDHLGIGYRFGPRRAFDLSYRFQHLSNAGIREPNPGINFQMVRLQYRF